MRNTLVRSCLLLAGLSGIPSCAVEDDAATRDVEAASTVEPVATAATCSYSIMRDSIKVIKGEGGLDPALELDVDTIVQYAGTTATNNYAGTIKNGDSVGTDVTIYSASVNVGTVVTHDWNVEAIEFDTLSADDRGSGGGRITFTCSSAGGTQTDSDSVNLGNAIIDVQVKAVW